MRKQKPDTKTILTSAALALTEAGVHEKPFDLRSHLSQSLPVVGEQCFLRSDKVFDLENEDLWDKVGLATVIDRAVELFYTKKEAARSKKN